MSKKTRSARGDEVDFDLLQIKAKLQKTDKPLDVKTREDYVHQKRRRRGSRKIVDMLKKDSGDNAAKPSTKEQELNNETEQTPNKVKKTNEKKRRKIVRDEE